MSGIQLQSVCGSVLYGMTSKIQIKQDFCILRCQIWSTWHPVVNSWETDSHFSTGVKSHVTWKYTILSINTLNFLQQLSLNHMSYGWYLIWEKKGIHSLKDLRWLLEHLVSEVAWHSVPSNSCINWPTE